MQKTDAELIAEVEKWRTFSGPWTLSLVHEVRVVADELARRLKAANERIEQENQRIDDAKSLFKHLISELQNSAECLGDYRTGNDCAELSCCGLLCNELEDGSWECARCGKVYG